MGLTALFRRLDGFFLNCVDPGGDTGMSLFHVRKDGFRLVEYTTVEYRPREGKLPTATLVEWRLTYPGVHHLLYEDFHLRNTSEAAGTDLTALRVLGSIDQLLYDRGNPYEEVHKQEPVEAKNMATDEVLEKLDLHMGHMHHQRHVRDANRHAVVHLAKLGYPPVCRVAFPRRSVRIPSLPGSRP